MAHDEVCEISGFAASQYELESDITSTAALAPDLVAFAAAGLDTDRLEQTHDGVSIAELVESAGHFEGEPIDVAHNGLRTMAQIGDLRHALGYGPTPGSGTVTGLHLSSGGVPKTAVDSVEVTRGGVVGDQQNNRIHHGRPLQALCIWSADVMAALNDEGHPVAPGIAGENIAVDGIDWASLIPGSRMTIGEIPVLISSYAVPCSKVGPGFIDNRFDRILHTKHPGWSRLYAIPLAVGSLSIGDAVSVA